MVFFRKCSIPAILLLCAAKISLVAQTGAVFALLKGSPLNTSGWSLQGAAAVGNVTQSGNQELLVCPIGLSTSGSVFYATPVDLGVCDDRWAAEFDFRIFDGISADGLAFCYLDKPPVGFVTGGGLGIPASANGLKVCFDTYNNCGNGTNPKIEIRYGIGYDECWSQATADNNGGTLSFLRSDSYNHAKIVYRKGNISVYVNDILYLTGFQLINFAGYFGFTASTGGAYDNHSIKNAVIYPIANTTALQNISVCSGAPVQLGNGSTANYSYKWSPANGLSATDIANPQAILTNTTGIAQTQKYYLVSSYNNLPVCAALDSTIVTVLPAQSLTFGSGVVTASSVQFSWNSVSGATDYSYSYKVNGGAAVSGLNGNATTKTISGLSPGDIVAITVTPVGSNCTLAASQSASALTTCAPVATNPELINIQGGSTATYTFPASGSIAGYTLDIWNLDNSFNITVNGMPISSKELEYDPSGVPGNNPVVFANGFSYGQNGVPSVWNLTGNAANPLIRVQINPDGTVQFFGSQSSGGALMPMFPSIPLNNFSWNATGSNQVVVGQAVIGPTGINGTQYGLLPVSSAGNDVTDVCAGNSTALTGTPNTGVWSVQASPANPTISSLGGTIAGAATVSFPANAGGIYKYIYTVNGTCNDTVKVSVNPLVVPTFTQVSPVCQGSTIADLPTIANNNINGTWSPALNTAATTSYTFTPNAGQCASTASMMITVMPVPVFNNVNVSCSGGIINSVTVLATVTTGVLEYSLDAGAFQTNDTFTAISQGQHSFNIRVVGTSCVVNSGVQNIQCNCPSVSGNTISADQSICNGTAPSAITGADAIINPVSAIAYQWQSSADGIAFADINGAVLKNFSPQALIQTTWYRRQIKITGCANDNSNAIKILVNQPEQLAVTCGAPSFGAISFTWNNINGATGYGYTYTINNGNIVTGSVTTNALNLTGIAPGASVNITVTPMGVLCALPGNAFCNSPVCPAVSNNSISPAQAICSGSNPAILTGSDANLIPQTSFNYQWQSGPDGKVWNDVNNANASDFTPAASQQTAYYQRLVQVPGCAAIASNIIMITVNPNLLPSFSFPVDYCLFAQPAILPAQSDNGIKGQWDKFSISTQLPGQSAYLFTPSTGECAVGSVKVIVKIDPPPPSFSLGNDTSFCKSDKIALLLNPSVNASVNYLWQDGSSAPQYQVSKEGVYSLTISNTCGKYADTIKIVSGEVFCRVFLPNIFTPNNDGNNDVFRVKYPFPVKAFSLVVYNRWGQKIFETNDIYKGWDGKYRGVLQPRDGYAWILNIKDEKNNAQTLRGVVLLEY